MKKHKDDLIADIQHSLQFKKCWYVSCGGSAASSFTLALGEKVQRKYAIRNRAHPPQFRNFEGEANLLVWCSWRLDNAQAPIASSDCSSEEITNGLSSLRDQNVDRVEIQPGGMDLVIGFSNGSSLRVFCDHVGLNPSFDGNWELINLENHITVGVGSELNSRPRFE